MMVKVVREFDKFSNNYVTCVDNGGFLDGRQKTLKKYGLQNVFVATGYKVPKKSKKRVHKMCSKVTQYTKKIQRDSKSKKFKEFLSSKPMDEFVKKIN